MLDAAVAMVDQRGLRHLTMRALGTFLGVDAMALYRYTRSRDDLLDGIVETVVDELYDDPEVRLHADDGWQDYLRRLAQGVRRMALDHPQVFPLVATHPPAAPWVRPPLRSLRWVEAFVAALTGQGFTDDDALVAYRGFSSFLLGHLLLEVSGLGVAIAPVPGNEPTDDLADGPAEPPTRTRARRASTPDAVAAVDALAGYPHLARLGLALSEDHSAEEFDQALETLLQRLAVLTDR